MMQRVNFDLAVVATKMRRGTVRDHVRIEMHKY